MTENEDVLKERDGVVVALREGEAELRRLVDEFRAVGDHGAADQRELARQLVACAAHTMSNDMMVTVHGIAVSRAMARFAQMGGWLSLDTVNMELHNRYDAVSAKAWADVINGMAYFDGTRYWLGKLS